jgi:hypothetical protein
MLKDCRPLEEVRYARRVRDGLGSKTTVVRCLLCFPSSTCHYATGLDLPPDGPFSSGPRSRSPVSVGGSLRSSPAMESPPHFQGTSGRVSFPLAASGTPPFLLPTRSSSFRSRPIDSELVASWKIPFGLGERFARIPFAEMQSRAS